LRHSDCMRVFCICYGCIEKNEMGQDAIPPNTYFHALYLQGEVHISSALMFRNSTLCSKNIFMGLS
jgi:hypothetical protein